MTSGPDIAVGDVWRVPLRGRVVGLCRVIASEKPRGSGDRAGRWRVVTCDWVGPRSGVAAALADPRALAPLVRHAYGKRAHVQSIGGPPPPSFVRVGHVPPTPADRAIRSPRPPGTWLWVSTVLESERAHRRNPARAEAERDARTNARRRARRSELAEARRRAAERRIVPVGARDVRAIRRLARATIDLGVGTSATRRTLVRAIVRTLRALGEALLETTHARTIRAALVRATRAIDRIDRRADRALTTPDAEAIVERLVAMAIAAGLDARAAEDAIDEVRDF